MLNSVSAEIEETVYITFNEDGTAHIKQITTIFTLDEGYYMDALTYDEFFPSVYENVQIHDNGRNLLKKILVESNETGTLFRITTPEVNEGYRYDVFYEYDYPNAQVVYKKNFDIELYLLRPDPSIVRRIILCLPKNAIAPIKYDSTPKDWKESSNLIIVGRDLGENSNIATVLEEPDQTFCGEGTREDVIPSYDEYVDTVNKKYSIPNADASMSEYAGSRLVLSVPKRYEDNLIFLKNAEKTWEYFKNLDFKIPQSYKISVVDQDDRVFGYDEEQNGILCYEDGICFVTNSIFRDSTQYQIANIVLSIASGAFINTYGAGFDNWWEDGATVNLVMESMKAENIPINELEGELILSIKENSDFLNNDPVDSSSNRWIATKIVSELEKICVGHIKKINEYMIEERVTKFDEQKNFNNFLIYAFMNVCGGQDISQILSTYNKEFDDVVGQTARHERIQEKVNLIPKEIELKEFNDFIEKTAEVHNYFITGDINSVSNRLTVLEKDYEHQVVPLMDKIKRYVDIKEKINQAGFNIFKFVSKKHLLLAQNSFSAGEFISADKELDLAEKWLENGPRYSLITLLVSGMVMFAAYYYFGKRKS